MTETSAATLRPPICPDCGHRGNLHRLDGCRALLLGRGTPSRACGCTTTLRAILAAASPQQPPAELAERR